MLKGKKIGFIGAGNMGSAIAGGLISSGTVNPSDIFVTDIDINKANEFAKSGANVLPDAKTLASSCDVVVFAVKPQVYEAVLSEIGDIVNPLYISIGAGVSINFVSKFFKNNARIIRVMPNTPALISEGMTVISPKQPVIEEDLDIAKQIFESIGLVEIMPEKYLDAVTSVSGSSPAYVYMMIEAMADAAVMDGIPRDIAYKLAAQSVAGSAKMVLETKQHPGKLKDNVCSPAGTTICAVAQLEQDGFRSAIINAMRKCTERSKEISR